MNGLPLLFLEPSIQQPNVQHFPPLPGRYPHATFTSHVVPRAGPVLNPRPCLSSRGCPSASQTPAALFRLSWSTSSAPHRRCPASAVFTLQTQSHRHKYKTPAQALAAGQSPSPPTSPNPPRATPPPSLPHHLPPTLRGLDTKVVNDGLSRYCGPLGIMVRGFNGVGKVQALCWVRWRWGIGGKVFQLLGKAY